MKRGVSYEAGKIAHAMHTGEGRDKVYVARSGAAHFIFHEPTCIECGCTWLNACLDRFGQGCAWIRVDMKTNRGLCSACGQKGKKFNREEGTRMATKKIKKKDKKKAATKRKPPTSDEPTRPAA